MLPACRTGIFDPRMDREHRGPNGEESCSPAHAARGRDFAPAGSRWSSEPVFRLKHRICNRETSSRAVDRFHFLQRGSPACIAAIC
jgi:hypothetical protein